VALAIDAVSKAIHRGVQNASKTYTKWSGLTLENSGSEGLLVAEVAAAIYRKATGPGHLELEVLYRKLPDRSGLGTKRTKRNVTDMFASDARADIAWFNGNNQLKYIIEVKRRLTWGKHMTADLERLVQAIGVCGRPNGTLTRCFFAAYLPRSPKKAKNNQERAIGFLKDRNLAGEFSYEVRGDEGSICIEVEP